jgi:hypothetical protein
VRDVSVDAREALARLERVELDLPATVRVAPGEPARFALRTRNLAEVGVDLYPIDLLVYFALRKEVEEIAGLSLDGLPPARTHRVRVPAGKLRVPTTSGMTLKDLSAGVYLVVARAGDLERRGLLIVSDIEVEIRAHDDGIRVRVTRRGTDDPVPGAFVKIAAGDRIAGEGRADARGVFEVAGRFEGPLSAVALKDGSYAITADG